MKCSKLPRIACSDREKTRTGVMHTLYEAKSYYVLDAVNKLIAI